MKAAVVTFPASNCDRDAAVVLEAITGRPTPMLWHRDPEIPADIDLIVVPGGFSYGDYLRCGAMAAHSPIMQTVKERAAKGTRVLGICNGFQVLTEAGLLPGALLRNRDLKFLCQDVFLRVENALSDFTAGYGAGQVIRIPIAHHDGNYFTDDETLKRLEGDGRVAFRYCAADGSVGEASNVNGSRNSIAGILNDSGNVLGLMPHPERLADPLLGGTDGKPMFLSLLEALG